jgi:hypothetical protein
MLPLLAASQLRPLIAPFAVTMSRHFEDKLEKTQGLFDLSFYRQCFVRGSR